MTEGPDESKLTTRGTMCPHCKRWKVYVEVPLRSRITDDESLADGEVTQACLDCGTEATVYYRLDRR